LSPPSVNMQLKITPRYRGPGYWRASSVEMVLHTGSHVDFSAHVRADGETAIDVPLDRFSGEALVVNVGPCEPSHGVSVADLEKAAPEIRPGDIVLVRTDWTDRMWGQFPDYYLTSPYCTPEAARWLVAKKPKAIGFDCFSEYSARLPDFTSEDFVIHKIILESGVYYFQQMTNLGALPADRRFTFFAPCLKMREAEGSPARFFALLEE
ncbi:MAG: cyclase family protein, partial [Anaerolineales bacterium]|nr:cyclase family protein [Anaerolineales bacterium]